MTALDPPQTVEATCPVCGGSRAEDVLSLPALPILMNAQVRPEEAPDVPRGDIDLVVCLGCGHLFNRSFDPGLLDYDVTYENTLHFSEQFRQYARALAERLVASHGLVGGTVAELGSGPGHFLSLLCEAGVGEGLGFDPSHDAGRFGAPDHESVRVSSAAFPVDGSLHVDLALSQHVLEHLGDPVAALAAQRAAVAPRGGAVYTEVPNGQFMLEKCALWDLIYEHVSYFVPTSLELACRLAGLDVSVMGSEFGDQFLWCEARAESSVGAEVDAQQVERAVLSARSFGEAARRRLSDARHELMELGTAGPVALWGAGSKGMTYLNLVGDTSMIAAVVDLNPRKAGYGIPGTSLVIGDPSTLAGRRVSTVLVSNPIYVCEIEQQLADLGIVTDVRPLWE